MDDIMDGTVVVPLFMSVIVGFDKIGFVDLNRKIVLVDDIGATYGSLRCVTEMVRDKLKANVLGAIVITTVKELEHKKVEYEKDFGIPVISLL